MKTKSDPICDVFSVGLIFHILLMGRSIFPGKTYNDVLVQNRACDFHLDSVEYARISRSALSLLKGMLEKTPGRRITAAEALKHSYFTEMEIEGAMGMGVGNYPETPLMKVVSTGDENTRPQEHLWAQNKVSIYK